jgi:hypothetical protein
MILDYFTSGGHAAEPFEPAHKISRRSFIQAGAAAGGGLMLSLRLPIAGGEAGAANAETFAPNAFIRIDGEGQIVLTMPYVEMGLVSRVTPVHTAQRNCTRDGGWPFEFGNQVSISSHRKLLSSKATVVNVAETSGHDPGRHGRERRAQANRCGSVEMRLGDVKTGG